MLSMQIHVSILTDVSKNDSYRNSGMLTLKRGSITYGTPFVLQKNATIYLYMLIKSGKKILDTICKPLGFLAYKNKMKNLSISSSQ